MAKIIQKENPTLRKRAKEVSKEEIGSDKIKKVISEMSRSLSKEEDGVAIAAPQIGESLRIFLVSGRFFTPRGGLRKDPLVEGEEYKDLVFINPEVEKESKEKQEIEEGCLSVRWLYGKVKRAKKFKVKALNERGEKISMGGSGLLSQVFQHEIDHLNGILFIDKAEGLEEMPPKEKKG